MFIDNEVLISVPSVALDLEALRSGPGEPIHLAVINDSVVDGTYTGPIGALDMRIDHGDTQTEAEAGTNFLLTVEVLAGQDQYFHLPATTKRWISIPGLPANAAVAVIYPGAEQTNM